MKTEVELVRKMTILPGYQQIGTPAYQISEILEKYWEKQCTLVNQSEIIKTEWLFIKNINDIYYESSFVILLL